MVLKTLRILKPEVAKELESSILRQKTLSLPLAAVCKILANQKRIPEAEAIRTINGLIFDQLLDKTQMSIIDSATEAPQETLRSEPMSRPRPTTPTPPTAPVIPTAPRSIPTPPPVAIPIPPVPVPTPPIPPAIILEPGAVLETEQPQKVHHPLLPKNLGAD
jgi:hypothetical protein